ncbi:hypothetical protein, partial [Enterococcus faecium]
FIGLSNQNRKVKTLTLIYKGVTEVVSFKKEEGMYENCFSNFCEISAYFRRSYFWNTVYSEKGGVTRILSHLPYLF